MIIGFLGKGGSGKSTLSTRFVQHLVAEQARVLAIDADHNMDLTFNLSNNSAPNFYGSSLSEMITALGFPNTAHYDNVLIGMNRSTFSLSPMDAFTKKYADQLSDQLFLMSAGPHTSQVLDGESCSHSLFTPLKLFLPLLQLQENEFVVVDEKAGTDGAGTGIPTGFTCAIVSSEPTTYGIKAANQIAAILEFFNVPYEFALNKVQQNYEIGAQLKKIPRFIFPFDAEFANIERKIPKSAAITLTAIQNYAQEIHAAGDIRLERSRAKFLRKTNDRPERA